MGSGPHGDAGPVDHRRHVMRMRTLHLERDDRALVARLPDGRRVRIGRKSGAVVDK